MNAITGRIARSAVVECRKPTGEPSGIRLAAEEIEVVLPDEVFRAVNRIGGWTSCRSNRYVLNSDRIRAGAAGIITGRVNKQMKRNIQREVSQRNSLGNAWAVGRQRQNSVDGSIRPDRTPSIPAVQNINQGVVSGGS